jgi:transcriptional regulator with XRE-family HTH domain
MKGQAGHASHLPERQAVIVGANIRLLRQRKGWNQAKLGELMGWHSESTVCAAEGRRGGRQRGFTAAEVERLAAIFGVPPRQLTTRCANCGGNPPAGFACLACEGRACPPVESDDPTPWVRMKTDLLRQMEAGVLEPGDEVWVTCEARDRGLSPGVARKALRALVSEGKLAPASPPKTYLVI